VINHWQIHTADNRYYVSFEVAVMVLASWKADEGIIEFSNLADTTIALNTCDIECIFEVTEESVRFEAKMKKDIIAIQDEVEHYS